MHPHSRAPSHPRPSAVGGDGAMRQSTLRAGARIHGCDGMTKKKYC